MTTKTLHQNVVLSGAITPSFASVTATPKGEPNTASTGLRCALHGPIDTPNSSVFEQSIPICLTNYLEN